jgi:heterotetrameric sarcosine oxidase gamma subunit
MQAVLRRSALHHRLLAAGARMRHARGWEQAESFGDRDAEARDLRAGVVLADLSAQHHPLVQAHDLTDWLPSAPGLGEVALVANSGSPVRCCRLTDDSALFAGAAPPALPPAPDACCHVTDLTSGRTIVAVAGPRSLDLLRAATQVDLRQRAMPDRRCLQTSVARVPAILLRFDRSGVPAYEILVPRDFGEYLWDALLDAGAPVGVRPVGAAALDRGD